MSFPITCTACNKTFTISDEIYEKKVAGRVVTIKCKSCSHGIRIDGMSRAAAPAVAAPATAAPAAPAPAAAPPAEPLWAVDYPDGQDREFTTSEVMTELERGIITRATLVWRDGMAEWLEAAQVPEFSGMVAKLEARRREAEQAALAAAAAAVRVAAATASVALKQSATSTPIHTPRPPMPTETGLGGLPGAEKRAKASDADKARIKLLSTTNAATPRAKLPSASELDKARAKLPSASELTPRTQQASSPDLTPRTQQASSPDLTPRTQQASSPDLTKPRAKAPSASDLGKPRATQPSVPRATQPSVPRLQQTSSPELKPRAAQASSPLFAQPPSLPPVTTAPAPVTAAPAPPPVAPLASAPMVAPTPPPVAPAIASPPAFAAEPPPFDLEAPFTPPPAAKLPFTEADVTPPLPPTVTKAVAQPFAGAGSPSVAPAVGAVPALISDHATVEWPEAKRKKRLIVGGFVVAAALLGGGVFFLSRTEPLPGPTPIAAVPGAASPAPGGRAEGSSASNPSLPSSDTASGGDPIAAGRNGATPGAGFAELFAAGARKAESKGATVAPAARFDAAATQAPLAQAANEAQACKESGGPTGKVTVVVTFDPSGKVSSATINDAPFAGTATATCISSALKRASIAPFSGLPGTVSKTFSIL